MYDCYYAEKNDICVNDTCLFLFHSHIEATVFSVVMQTSVYRKKENILSRPPNHIAIRLRLLLLYPFFYIFPHIQVLRQKILLFSTLTILKDQKQKERQLLRLWTFCQRNDDGSYIPVLWDTKDVCNIGEFILANSFSDISSCKFVLFLQNCLIYQANSY